MKSVKQLIEDRNGSEFSANAAMANQVANKAGDHHVYVKTKGKMKSIAGPFHSKEAAESSPQRKFGDGVALGHMCESFEQIDEARMPLKGHDYHTKSDDELNYIVKDAGEAAVAMKNHNPEAEAKYLDQVNDASTVLHFRKNGGKQAEKKVQEMTQENNLFESKFVQVNEILAYLKHANDHIATNGTHYHVGTKKGNDGKYEHDHMVTFTNQDDAKSFIDGGKKDASKAMKKNIHSKTTVKESFVDAAISKNFVQAEQTFSSLMAEKVQITLAARKIEIAQSMYSKAS
jgi:hypothetical protein